MNVADDFKLLVPCGYGPTLAAKGTIGARPDIQIVGGRETCVRSKLPRTLDRLTFNFPRKFLQLNRQHEEFIQNFYHQGEFFVVTTTLRDWLTTRLPNALEIAPIDVRHHDGTRAAEIYFAVKVTRTIDCIDPKSSYRRWADRSPNPSQFSDNLTTYDLGPEVADEFANCDGGKYISYPYVGVVREVRLMESRIPADACLFRPAFWPEALILTSSFAEQLARQCAGGTLGYYFWTLSLSSPELDLGDLHKALR
jgi:hypothetical protein